MREFSFDGLFILDIANNHQGSLKHGLKIIRELGDVVNDLSVRAAVKFQYRQLESFCTPIMPTEMTLNTSNVSEEHD